ncbi:hypothetical protein ACFCWY_08760 [Streptomyces sp. NPDC056362]|uniref:hypothetical protein n=1 Tax=unclassified Streptomyces TaxID=2593676 RepID=UPI0035DA2B2B
MPKAGVTYGPRIPAPDYAEIDKQAAEEAREALGLNLPPQNLMTMGADEVFDRSSRIVTQANAELAMYLEERDQALAHFWFYEPRRFLAQTAGLSYMGLRGAITKLVYGDKKHPLPDVESNEELVRIGEELGVRRVKDAEEQLLNASKIVRAAHQHRKEAMPYMQQATLALSKAPYNWTPERMAEHAGVDRKLIYNMRTAALKREA